MEQTILTSRTEALLELARTQGDRLEMTQVLDAFAKDTITPEEMEEVQRSCLRTVRSCF